MQGKKKRKLNSPIELSLQKEWENTKKKRERGFPYWCRCKAAAEVVKFVDDSKVRQNFVKKLVEEWGKSNDQVLFKPEEAWELCLKNRNWVLAQYIIKTQQLRLSKKTILDTRRANIDISWEVNKCEMGWKPFTLFKESAFTRLTGKVKDCVVSKVDEMAKSLKPIVFSLREGVCQEGEYSLSEFCEKKSHEHKWERNRSITFQLRIKQENTFTTLIRSLEDVVSIKKNEVCQPATLKFYDEESIQKSLCAQIKSINNINCYREVKTFPKWEQESPLIDLVVASEKTVVLIEVKNSKDYFHALGEVYFKAAQAEGEQRNWMTKWGEKCILPTGCNLKYCCVLFQGRNISDTSHDGYIKRAHRAANDLIVVKDWMHINNNIGDFINYFKLI